MEYTEKANNTFTDVENGTWYTDYILKVVASGVMSGYGNGNMGTNDNLTRQDAAVILCRAIGIEAATDTSTGFADNSSIANYAKGYVAAMSRAGLINGYPDGSFYPAANITRAEVVTIVNNAIALYVVESGTYSGTYNGNVIVKANNVVFDGATIKGNLIVSDSVTVSATLIDTVVEGKIVGATKEDNTISTYKDYPDVPDFSSVTQAVVISNEAELKTYNSNDIDKYTQFLVQSGFALKDSYTTKYEDSRLLTQYGKVSIYTNSTTGTAVHILSISDVKLGVDITFLKFNAQLIKPDISQCLSEFVIEYLMANNGEDYLSSPFKNSKDNYKYGHMDSIYSKPLYVTKSNVTNATKLETYLTSKYKIVYSPIGEFKLDIDVSGGGAYNIHVDFGYVSSDFSTVIAPLNFTSTSGLTKDEKYTTMEMFEQLMSDIYGDVNDIFPGSLISGSVFVSGYKYPNLQMGYYSYQTMSWSNWIWASDYSERTYCGFYWDTNSDDFALNKELFK